MPLWVFLLLLAVPLCIIYYNYQKFHLYLLASKLPGPVAVPIFGNSLKFICNPSDAFNVMFDMMNGFPKPLRIWLGPHLLIAFEDPVHLQKILLSNKMTYKHDIYDIIKNYLGNGLISNSGPLWKYHRKIIQPFINSKNFSNSLDCIQNHVSILMSKLGKHVNGSTFDIHNDVHYCCADIITEIILGMQLNFQFGQNVEYIESLEQLYTLCYSRMIRPWIHPDLIYKFTSNYKTEVESLKQIQAFAKRGIDESLIRILNENNKIDNEFVPLIDQILFDINDNPETISEKDLIHHLLTLFLASEDTITLNVSFLCVLFGMYPKYQKLAAEEVYTVLGKSCEHATLADFQKLKYLDMCLNEVLRLMPIAPIILRKTVENFEIDKLVIPEGCAVVMAIMNTHRHPDHWEHPNEFYPDHFLPDAVEKRHSYAFVPFSAGPRGCIGKLYAYGALRILMANILQRFEIEADGSIDDIKLKADISVRSQSGYKIRLKERMFN